MRNEKNIRTDPAICILEMCLHGHLIISRWNRISMWYCSEIQKFSWSMCKADTGLKDSTNEKEPGWFLVGDLPLLHHTSKSLSTLYKLIDFNDLKHASYAI